MSLLNNLKQLCIEKGVSIAVAESCTAGLIASKLTTLPGSSSYFNGGVVAYQNEIKIKILGVSQSIIDEKTEVSVGRGTKTQFQIYGHPDFNEKFSFIPKPNFGSQNPKLNGIKSNGEDLRDYKTINRIELKWLINSYNQIKDKKNFFRSDFNKLSGSSKLQDQIKNGIQESIIRDSWVEGLEEFKKIRSKYLLY